MIATGEDQLPAVVTSPLQRDWHEAQATLSSHAIPLLLSSCTTATQNPGWDQSAPPFALGWVLPCPNPPQLHPAAGRVQAGTYSGCSAVALVEVRLEERVNHNDFYLRNSDQKTGVVGDWNKG